MNFDVTFTATDSHFSAKFDESVKVIVGKTYINAEEVAY